MGPQCSPSVYLFCFTFLHFRFSIYVVNFVHSVIFKRTQIEGNRFWENQKDDKFFFSNLIQNGFRCQLDLCFWYPKKPNYGWPTIWNLIKWLNTRTQFLNSFYVILSFFSFLFILVYFSCLFNLYVRSQLKKNEIWWIEAATHQRKGFDKNQKERNNERWIMNANDVPVFWSEIQSLKIGFKVESWISISGMKRIAKVWESGIYFCANGKRWWIYCFKLHCFMFENHFSWKQKSQFFFAKICGPLHKL